MSFLFLGSHVRCKLTGDKGIVMSMIRGYSIVYNDDGVHNLYVPTSSLEVIA